ncbi:arginine N-succinyltransferase [Catenovulum sp. SM1970]|uniref:arginine N-succinyltransferase n=1 Tax=Marinifaba aquimaris TaxID=2741323 RepID=UPI0015741897|nr:arginine N-succinyltransferase [Marinifaba aquimaris]NTS78875.1 arginine N-succinyltransferase [Marinifaba aquimaris]
MLLIRPIQKQDLDNLLVIAHDSGHGFTSLPANRELLENKIKRSCQSIEADVGAPGDQAYLFVLEDTEQQKIVGTCGIEAAVGLDDAFYHYRLSKVVHSSRELKIYNTADVLTLCNDYTGGTEICTLYLSPDYRDGLNGRALSKVRFLFMAEHIKRFSQQVFAEMRGVSDDDGVSPFWRWLDNHFFSMDFPTADYLTGIGNKQFIAELMPKYPIYVNLLSNDAQAVIGKVHEKTKPALALLEQEGFEWRGYVDIFDAGPTVEAKLEEIKSVKNSQKVSVELNDTSQVSEQVEAVPYLVVNTHLEDFRGLVVYSEIDAIAKTISMTQEQATALKVKSADTVRALKLA